MVNDTLVIAIQTTYVYAYLTVSTSNAWCLGFNCVFFTYICLLCKSHNRLVQPVLDREPLNCRVKWLAVTKVARPILNLFVTRNDFCHIKEDWSPDFHLGSNVRKKSVYVLSCLSQSYVNFISYIWLYLFVRKKNIFFLKRCETFRIPRFPDIKIHYSIWKLGQWIRHTTIDNRPIYSTL